MNDQSADEIEQAVDIEGFVKWVEYGYLDDRLESVTRKENSVTVVSGEHPDFRRFQRDIKPRLHEHGLVITHVRENTPFGAAENGNHSITAEPVTQVIAATQGRICRRLVCENITDEPGTYCDECGPLMREATGNA